MTLKRNVIANYLGQGWVAIMGIAFIPLYVKYLGIESYGLIGFFATLQASLMLLDLGMSPTLNREMARYTAGAHTVQTINNLLFSLELICFSLAIVIGLLIFFSSNWLANDWLQVKSIPLEEVSYTICIMGIVVALRFIEGLYRGALLGLQKQVLFNVVNSLVATLRSCGVLGVLIWVSPTIEAFFLWQGAVSILTILILKVVVYKTLPTPEVRSKFSIEVIRKIWRFASGMMTTTLLSLLLLQTDKVLLSRLLSLEAFGHYTFAASVAGALYLLAVPIAQSFSPRFTELVTLDDSNTLIQSYHLAAQLVTVMVMPAAMILIFFTEPLILVWTSNEMLATKASPVIQVLAIGCALNALMYTPYMMQLGYGWVKFSVRVNFFAVVILVPALIIITPQYGVIGAAWCWTILNFLYVFLASHFMHKRILVNEKWRWYIYDVLLPTLSGATVISLSWLIHPLELSRMVDFFWIFITGILAFTSALCASNILRNHLYNLTLAVRN